MSFEQSAYASVGVSSCPRLMHHAILCFFSSQVNCRTVLWGFGLQFVFALIVLRWPAGYAVFKWLGDRAAAFVACSDAGAEFVFGASYRDHFVAFQASVDVHVPWSKVTSPKRITVFLVTAPVLLSSELDETWRRVWFSPLASLWET